LNLWPRKKNKQEERRKPENAERRLRFDGDQRAQVQQDLNLAQTLTAENAARLRQLGVMVRNTKRES